MLHFLLHSPAKDAAVAGSANRKFSPHPVQCQDLETVHIIAPFHNRQIDLSVALQPCHFSYQLACVTAIRPKTEVGVAGLPMEQVVGHHPPSTTKAENVKNPVENGAAGVPEGESPYLVRSFWKEWTDEGPFRICQTAGILSTEGFSRTRACNYRKNPLLPFFSGRLLLP